MKTLMVVLAIFAYILPVIAGGNTYTDGVDAFREKGDNEYTAKVIITSDGEKRVKYIFNTHPYKDADGKPINGIVIKNGTFNGKTNVEHVTVVDGIANGLTTRYYDGHKIEETEMLNGVRHGKYTSYHPDGTISSTGTYIEGNPQGLLSFYREDGELMSQLWTHNDIMLAEFEYENGKPVPSKRTVANICGLEEYQIADAGIKYYMLNRDAFIDEQSKLYVDIKKNPITGHVTYVKEKNVTEMDVLNGFLEGVSRVYDDGRLVSETHYTGGRKHGVDIVYYENGHPELLANFAHDVIDGLVTRWQKNGKIEQEVIFRGGKAIYGYIMQKGKIVPMTSLNLKGAEQDMEDFYL